MAKRNLVVVESAAKAKTIEKFLGRDYVVRASYGHVRDLPDNVLGVDTEHDFQPTYVVSPEKKDVVKRLKDEAKGAEAVYLATDPDREGEAIAWHLVHALGLKGRNIHRVEFHEITKDAIVHAVQHPRQIDEQRVDAQQARRVLDRLVGFKVSQLLWKKVRRGLSAGRVQSVAVRIVVDRERERDAFVPVEYWSIEADLRKRMPGTPVFRAALTEQDGKKVDRFDLKNEEQAQRIVGDLHGAGWAVREVKKSERQRSPAPPFTTSTLQQDASRKLGFTARQTMALAQQLYEGMPVEGGESVGLITYMRTDSVTVAETAIAEVRQTIASRYGSEYVPAQPRIHRTRSRMAQEAHEAIRPTSSERAPERVQPFLLRAGKDERDGRNLFRLYTLIWQRFVASQMASAIFDQTTADIDAHRDGGSRYTFRATGSVPRFLGFLSVYREGKDDGDTADEDGQPRLPELAAGERLDLLKLMPEQHFTQPPPRFTEATLVKALEEHGIGRPSTYAPILSVIRDRGYVEMEERRFKPTDLGYLVNDMLVGNFRDIVDVQFTAGMEQKLDDIAQGERPWVPVMREFYDPFAETLDRAQREVQHVNQTAEVTDKLCDKCGKPMSIKLGRFGRFLSCTGYPDCKNARPLNADDSPPEVSDEVCENCGKPMLVKTGRFGKFLSCSDYPDCKTSRPILVKLGLTCPKCNEGELVEKKGRTGRPFYGCARYPACDWVCWSRPLPDPCETCGKLRIPLGADKIHCMGCDGDLPVRQRKTDADGKPIAGRGRTGGRTAAASTSRGRATAASRAAASGEKPAPKRAAAATSTARRTASGAADGDVDAVAPATAAKPRASRTAASKTAAGKAKTATAKASASKSTTAKSTTKSGAAAKSTARTRASSTSTRAKRAS
ncbi:MAG: type I DNA topoisomerase [Chloroflexi bacterium]|nr:type I DNA topoisomerase [Chloroflexota bacterium]